MTRFGSIVDAPASVVLVGGRVVDPAARRDEIADVAIVAGTIADAAAAPGDAERLDARGLIVAPAFVDLHTHLREPGDPAAETVATGTRAAAAGGYATVCAMPNTDPALDDPDAVRRVTAAGAGAACRVRVVAAATRGRHGAESTDLAALHGAGAVGWSDDGASIADVAVLDDLLRASAALRAPLIEHAEDPTLAAGSVMRAGPTAALLGLGGWPPDAEAAIVARDLDRLTVVGGRLHLTHLSTARAVELLRGAKARGLAVTADVTPHHLACADTWVAGDRAWAWEEPRIDPLLAYDTSCRVNPPLASRDDAAALRLALADGTIDAIATDHAPHPTPVKLVPFADAAPGLVGLETALSIGLALVDAGALTLVRLLEALGPVPAALIAERRSLEPGAVADVVAFDPAVRWRVRADRLASRSANTPFRDLDLTGRVRLTVAAGRVTYRA